MKKSIKSAFIWCLYVENARKLMKICRYISIFIFCIVIIMDICVPISVHRYQYFWKRLACYNEIYYTDCKYYINYIYHALSVLEFFVFLFIIIILSFLTGLLLYLKDKKTIEQVYFSANTRRIFNFRPISQKQTLQRLLFFSIFYPIFWYIYKLIFNISNYSLMLPKDLPIFLLLIESLFTIFSAGSIVIFVIILSLMFFDIPPP